MIRIVTGKTAKESTDNTANKNTSSIARSRLASNTVMNIAALREIVPLNLLMGSKTRKQKRKNIHLQNAGRSLAIGRTVGFRYLQIDSRARRCGSLTTK